MRGTALICASLLAACGANRPPPGGDDAGGGDADAAPVACASPLDCLSGEVCINGFCQPVLADGGACRGNGDCADPARRFCSGGACVECKSEIDCDPDKNCVSSVCVPRGDAGADAGSDAGADASADADANGDADASEDAGADAAADADAGTDAGDDSGDGGFEDAGDAEGRACTGVGTCPLGFACISMRDGGAFCRVPCDPYAPSCAADRFCTWTGFSGSQPTGACVPAQQGHALGEACASDDPCAVEWVCIRDDAAASHCRRACDFSQGAQAGGCAAPDACQAVPLGDGIFIGLCFPDGKFLDSCGHNSECTQGLVCSVGSFPNDPYVFHNQCDWSVGASATGDPCTAPEQCDTGICLSLWRSCYGACRTEADCPDTAGASACLDIGFQQQSPNGTVYSTLPSCLPECASDLACGNDVCGVFLNHEGNEFAAVCVPRAVGAGNGGAGSRCDADADCMSGACFTGGTPASDGFCLGACAQPADCLNDTACPSDGVMLSVGNGQFASAPICWGKPCATDAECAGQSLDPTRPRVCTAFINPNDTDDIVLDCYPRSGVKRGGEVCGTSAECASDWCVNFGTTGKRCFGGCASNTDCLGGAVCTNFDWGNGQACQTDAQCPRPQICSNSGAQGLVCRHFVQMCAPP